MYDVRHLEALFGKAIKQSNFECSGIKSIYYAHRNQYINLNIITRIVYMLNLSRLNRFRFQKTRNIKM